MAQAPRTRYAKCGDLDIAYQVFGEGPTDVVVLPGPLIPIDSIDAEPALYRFHRRLASFARVLRFDHRGMGLSSHVPASDRVGPDQWAQDAIAVMDAAGCEEAVVFGSGLTGMSGFVLAADYPQRVRNLVIVNGTARILWAADYEIGVQMSAAVPFSTIAVEPDAFDQGFDVLNEVGPSVSHDEAFRSWWDNAGNRAMPPSMARVVTESITESDVRDRLARITAPTLVLHRGESRFVPAAHGRYLAEHISGSRYVELPGVDTLHWVGDTGPMLDEIEEFITGVRGSAGERVLTTMVFTDIVGSTHRAAELGDRRWHDLLDNHDRIVRNELGRFRGREVNTAGDGFVATFTSPSLALDCAEAIVDAVRPLGIEVRAGVHAGEVEMRGADIAGMAVHIAARVGALAGPNEVLVSSTVRDIVTGSRRSFADHGEHDLKGVPGSWRLYSLAPQHATVRR